jgi:hypothetical protein
MGGNLRSNQTEKIALKTAVIIKRILMSIFKILKIIIENTADDTINTAFKILFAATTRAMRTR